MKSLWYLVCALAACTNAVEPDGDLDLDHADSAAEGKADAVAHPLGSFRLTPHAVPDIIQVDLRADRTYHAELWRDRATVFSDGTYRFTSSGQTRYIRFTATTGSDVGDYAYRFVEGDDYLELRKVHTDGWTDYSKTCSGQRVRGVTYRPSPNDPSRVCSSTRSTCMTADASSCPATAVDEPACPSGTIVVEASPVVGANGDFCARDIPHCVTSNPDACPPLVQPDPASCADSTLVEGKPSFVPSTDGMECQIPNVGCLDRTCAF